MYLRRIAASKFIYNLRYQNMSSDGGPGPVESAIVSKLSAALTPSYLHVANDSHKHNVPKGSESHFSVTIVSDAFNGKSLIDRHRLVNTALADEMKTKIHALSIKAKTPEQWAADSSLNTTPACQGGSGK